MSLDTDTLCIWVNYFNFKIKMTEDVWSIIGWACCREVCKETLTQLKNQTRLWLLFIAEIVKGNIYFKVCPVSVLKQNKSSVKAILYVSRTEEGGTNCSWCLIYTDKNELFFACNKQFIFIVLQLLKKLYRQKCNKKKNCLSYWNEF